MPLIVGPTNKTQINVRWDQPTDTVTPTTTIHGASSIHLKMKRCLLNADGTVNYYLDPLDSTKKADGTTSVLTGADGNVMVEIPKFSYKMTVEDNNYFWELALGKKSGYTVHPAFIKDGVEVNNRYISAYDACYLDATDGEYKSGLNLDNMTSNLDFITDKLSSVSGVYPLVGVTRAEASALAANNGTGWRIGDFWLMSAIQLLYLTEYGNFNSQLILGAGNTNGSYIASSANQADSPHSIAGLSNALGNRSTNGSQPSAGAKPGSAYMSYRGIENLFGNSINWVDGLVVLNYVAWATNDSQYFTNDVSIGKTNLGTISSASGWPINILSSSPSFLGTTVGGSSTSRLCDYIYVASANRVAAFGGLADGGAAAGVFCWYLYYASSSRLRSFGARLSF